MTTSQITSRSPRFGQINKAYVIQGGTPERRQETANQLLTHDAASTNYGNIMASCSKDNVCGVIFFTKGADFRNMSDANGLSFEKVRAEAGDNPIQTKPVQVKLNPHNPRPGLQPSGNKGVINLDA